MREVAVIIGGTFNPVTKAHMAMGEAIAQSLVKENITADIYYIPSSLSFISHWKDVEPDPIFTSDFRFELLSAAIKGKSCNYNLSDIEAKGTVDGKTINTVRYFYDELGYKEVRIAMGADKVDELPDWYEVDVLLSLSRIYLFNRSGMEIQALEGGRLEFYKDRFIPMDDALPAVSSTQVREAFHNGDMDTVHKMVPEPVYQILYDKI